MMIKLDWINDTSLFGKNVTNQRGGQSLHTTVPASVATALGLKGKNRIEWWINKKEGIAIIKKVRE